MKHYRRFVFRILVYLGLYLLVHLLTWKLFTEDLFTYHHYQGGDLARVGYVLGSKLYRHNYDDLPRRHIPFRNYSTQKIDLLTVGDSYANGVAGGRNRYFQDYLASSNNLDVLNIGLYKDASRKNGFNDPFETVLLLYNSGALRKIRPRYLLLESAEVLLKERLARHMDFSRSEPLADVMNAARYQDYQFDPEVTWINDGNMKLYYYALLHKFKQQHTGLGVSLHKLDRPLFSVKNSDLLLFASHDISEETRCDKRDIEVINRNLNQLASLLAGMGIKLCFLPAPNKSTVYYDYLLTKTIPPSILFEELRTLPKKYCLIDAKKILGSALQTGEKDVYYPDDTHWSWKAAEKIAGAVRFE